MKAIEHQASHAQLQQVEYGRQKAEHWGDFIHSHYTLDTHEPIDSISNLLERMANKIIEGLQL